MADETLQLFGGSGYFRATGLERYLRDVRVGRIVEVGNFFVRHLGVRSSVEEWHVPPNNFIYKMNGVFSNFKNDFLYSFSDQRFNKDTRILRVQDITNIQLKSIIVHHKDQ